MELISFHKEKRSGFIGFTGFTGLREIKKIKKITQLLYPPLLSAPCPTPDREGESMRVIG